MPSTTTGRAALTVLFGSNLGTAEALAARLADTAEARGMTVDLRPLDSAAGGLPDGDVAIVCSTYNGLPPDNARAFVAALDGLAAAGRRYAVFGCGHSDWSATFQAVPRRIDAALAERGGVRLLAAGEGDAAVDVEGAFEAWSAGVFTALGGQGAGTATDSAEPRYTVEIGPPRALNPIAETLGAAPMRVLVNRELQSWPEGDPDRRRTRHIELALPEGVRYRAGDHLGVVPLNDPARVRDAARRFGLDPAVTITLRTGHRRAGHLPVDRPVALGDVLGACVELDEPAARRHVEALAAHSPCPHTRRALERLSGDAHRAEVLTPRLSVLDLLQRFTACQPPLEVFLSLLPPLRPRYYSISSSPTAGADRCSVTVAVLEAPALGGGRVHRGVCSTHLARAPVGGSVLAFVRDTGSDFRPPADAETPMLMVGAGTGLAPYRGFLAERTALVDRGVPVGEHALFFGCRHPDRDLLYRPLLDGLVERDLLTLYPAFSRLDGQPKMYVQQRIEAEADAVWDLIERGAVIYVCGDAADMEPGVRAALQAVYRARTGAEDGAAWLDGLRTAGRYRVDVWA